MIRPQASRRAIAGSAVLQAASTAAVLLGGRVASSTAAVLLSAIRRKVGSEFET